MQLYEHQIDALNKIKDYHNCAIYYDMGLGKTYIGSEKMKQLNGRVNLLICQKSKIDDWVTHLKHNYDMVVLNLTGKSGLNRFCETAVAGDKVVGIINYDLLWRRKPLLKMTYDTVMLDESSLIANESSKRTRAIMKLHYHNCILLSGSICGGKYEQLYSQMKMLRWDITKTEWWNRYIKWHLQDYGFGIPFKMVDGYKNTDDMLEQMHNHGCIFKKTEEVLNLPSQNDVVINIPVSPEYKRFQRDKIVQIGDTELVGDTSLKELLYLRQLAGAYCREKIKAFKDLLESTDDRVVVFYNFKEELKQLTKIATELHRPRSFVNGSCRDIVRYDDCDNSITFVQYQAGAMGLNLQKANKIIYFSPCLSSDLYEQSRKRIHRIGQEKPCFYYKLTCGIEEKIYKVLAERRDFTDALFKEV